jgi:hypothetical protein
MQHIVGLVVFIRYTNILFDYKGSMSGIGPSATIRVGLTYVPNRSEYDGSVNGRSLTLDWDQ